MVKYITLTLEDHQKEMFLSEKQKAENRQKVTLSWEKFFTQKILRGSRK